MNLLLLLLLLLLLSGTPFQFQAPPLTVASEGQGTTQFILLLQNIGYRGPFPVYLRWENYLPFQFLVKNLARKSLPNAVLSYVIIIIINIIIIVITIIIIIIITISITVFINLIKLLQVKLTSLAIVFGLLNNR